LLRPKIWNGTIPERINNFMKSKGKSVAYSQRE
jgi:hypothetical protein